MSENPFAKLIRAQKARAVLPSTDSDTRKPTVEATPRPTSEGNRVNPLLALGKTAAPHASPQAKAVPTSSQQGTPLAKVLGTLSKAAEKSPIPVSTQPPVKANPLAALVAKKAIPAAPSNALATKLPTPVKQVAAAPAKAEEPISEDPLDMRERLDALDSLIQRDGGVTPFTFDAIRNHVQVIMRDLKTTPELDSILIDKDVRNIIGFVRHVKVEALATQAEKVVKKEKKAAKGGVGKINFDLAGALASLEDIGDFK